MLYFLKENMTFKTLRTTFKDLLCTFSMLTPSNGNIFRVTGQWRGALMFSLICVWINGWVNNREAGDLRRHRGHCDVSVMLYFGVVPVSTKVPYYITMIKIGSNKSLIHDDFTQFGHIYASRDNWSSMNTPYHFTHGVGLIVCPAMFSSISFTSLAFLTIKWHFPGLLSSSC